MSRLYRFIALHFILSVSGALVSGAGASDLTVKSSVSEIVEYHDNYALRSGASSGVLGAYSTATLSALQRTPTTTFQLGGDITYRKYFGPGVSAIGVSETTSDGLNMRFEKTGKLKEDIDYIGATYRRADAALSQRQDVGVSTVTGDIITYSANGGGNRQLNARDSVNWLASANMTTYLPTSSTSTPFNSILARVGWNHRTTETLDLIGSSDATWLFYDNATQTRASIWQTLGGLRLKLTSLLTFTANGGIGIVTKTQNSVTAAPAANAFDPITGIPFNAAPTNSGTALGPVWDIGITYKPLKSTDLTIAASQGVTPGTIGDISKRTSLSARVNYQINTSSSVNLGTTFTRIEPGNSPVSDFFTASAAYNYRLTREWNAIFAYNYRQRNLASFNTSGGSSAASNSVILTVVRDMTLKP